MIILSDGLPCEVKKLPLYALDHIGPKDPGEFTYKIKNLLGEIFDQPYNLQTRLDNPPQEPESDSDDTWKITEWERYQAAIAHNRKRHELAEERAGNVAIEVINRCLNPADRGRIVTADDYRWLYLAGVAQEVSEEDLADSLRDFFRGPIRQSGDFFGVRVLRVSDQRRFDRLSGNEDMGSRINDEIESNAGQLLGNTGEGESEADMCDEVAKLDRDPAIDQTAVRAQAVIASLIMYEARHGRVYHPSMQQWLYYYLAQQHFESLYTQAALLEMSLKVGQARMKQIVKQAQVIEPAQRRELLKEAIKLRGQMRHTEKKLKQYV